MAEPSADHHEVAARGAQSVRTADVDRELCRSLVALNEESMLTNYKIIGQVNTYLAALLKALQAEPYPV